MSNTAVAFDDTLNVQNKPDDGRIEFKVEYCTVPLQMKTGYKINKTAGIPNYSTDASSYLVDYTVTLALDQNMMLSDNEKMYTAALTLSSPDQKLNKGAYTFKYKMKLNSAAVLAKLSCYSDLPMYDEQEQIIVYSAKEKCVDGFLTIYDNVAPYADETKAIVKADFSVKKKWSGLAEGDAAPEITLVLYCNGVATDIKTPKPDRNGWYKYYDLPGEVDGVKAVYTVKEVAVDGYMTSYKLADGTSAEYADNGGTITNAKIPQTGDETPLALWLTLMGASAVMLMLLRKRRKA